MTGSRRSQTPKRGQTPEVHTPRLKSPRLGGSRKKRRTGTKGKSRSRKNAHRK